MKKSLAERSSGHVNRITLHIIHCEHAIMSSLLEYTIGEGKIANKKVIFDPRGERGWFSKRKIA
jgi:hypothetical protein